MFRRHTQLALSAFAAATLAACGGSDDPPVKPAVFFGTASTGAAVAAAAVDLTDAQGNPACQEATVTTGADGAYTCTLKSGATAPFLLVVSDPAKLAAPLVSVGDAAPAAGESLRLNATPLTTAIAAQLDPADDPMALAADRSLIDLAKFDTVRGKVLAQLADVLAALGLDDDYDPFDSDIVAADAEHAGQCGGPAAGPVARDARRRPAADRAGRPPGRHGARRRCRHLQVPACPPGDARNAETSSPTWPKAGRATRWTA